jgi:hypothetical protein
MDNTTANALFRLPVDNELYAVSVCRTRWLESIVEGYNEDEQAKTVLQELSLVRSNNQGYSLNKGNMRFKDRIWLGNNNALWKPFPLINLNFFSQSTLFRTSGVIYVQF